MGAAGTEEVGKALESLEGCPEETEDHSWLLKPFSAF